ncbi:hypothetical protein [Commensalibacter communis]|uniref:hypothetical protein n=1 Tax=Commensalibacter communis TaxID=2972786 RepID=UPI0022FF6BB3|nr:hypothetical protein [Commensalibacter communis]CAI3933723.1 unnamed protein product [Commensalibacter communis]CAI3944490.1 unnamed protein product [Commensalibacter communis]
MENSLLTFAVTDQEIVEKISFGGIIPTIEKKNQADPKRIVNWIRQLLDITIKKDQEITCSFVANLSLMLYTKFPRWSFSSNTLQYIAEKSKFFPTYHDLCALLPEAVEVIRQRQLEAKNNIEYRQEEDFNKLSDEAKGWVNIYYTKVFRHWREGKEEKDLDIQETERRENQYTKLMLKFCPEAYKYLFPREWAEQLRTPEKIKVEQKGNWVTDAGVLNTIREIELIVNPIFKKQTIFHFKNAISKHAPEWVELVDEQYPGSYEEKKEEKKQGVFA